MDLLQHSVFTAKTNYLRTNFASNLIRSLFINFNDIPTTWFLMLADSYNLPITDEARADINNYVVTINANGNIQHHKPYGYYITDEVHTAARQLYSKITNL